MFLSLRSSRWNSAFHLLHPPPPPQHGRRVLIVCEEAPFVVREALLTKGLELKLSPCVVQLMQRLYNIDGLYPNSSLCKLCNSDRLCADFFIGIAKLRLYNFVQQAL